MKFTKTLSVIAGSVSLLAASLAPMSASALSTASITMDGLHSSNGQFSVVVYEDTGSDSVTGAYVHLSFDQAVSNLNYDYSVGPFQTADPDGGHYAFGAITGKNPLARVSFTLASPGTVIADVDSSSYLKHAGDTTVENFAVNQGESYFTYDAPAPRAAATKTASDTASTPASTATDTPASLAPSAVKGDSTKQASGTTTGDTKSSHVGLVTSSVALLVLAAGAAYWLIIHKRTEVAPAVATYKLNPKGKSKTAGKKSTSHSKATKKTPAKKK